MANETFSFDQLESAKLPNVCLQFERVANEILRALESPRSRYWWKDIEELTWTLEELRSQIPHLLSTRNEDVKAHLGQLWNIRPKGIEFCPALLILTQEPGSEIPVVAKPHFKPLEWTEGRCVSMLCCDPYMRIGRGSRILLHDRPMRGEQLFATANSDAVRDAVFCLKSWITFVKSLPAESPPDGDPAKQETHDEIGPFQLQWLKWIFEADHDNTLKERLGSSLRGSGQEWYVSSAKLKTCPKWKDILQAKSEDNGIAKRTRSRLKSFLSLQ